MTLHSCECQWEVIIGAVNGFLLDDTKSLPEPLLTQIISPYCVTRLRWVKQTIPGYLVVRAWWRHQMETFSALLAICAGNSQVIGEFPAQRPVTRSFDVFFDLRLNKRLSKQLWGWCFETLWRPLWRHRNGGSSSSLSDNSLWECQFVTGFRCISVNGNSRYQGIPLRILGAALAEFVLWLGFGRKTLTIWHPLLC